MARTLHVRQYRKGNQLCFEPVDIAQPLIADLSFTLVCTISVEITSSGTFPTLQLLFESTVGFPGSYTLSLQYGKSCIAVKSLWNYGAGQR